MALIMYLTKAPRYQNIYTDEYETIPFEDLVLIDKYFFWSMRRAEGKTDAYTLEEWCGTPESKLPHKYVVNYYNQLFTEKRFYKEYVGEVTGFTVFTQVARIVKANQILRWFVENVMSGKMDKEHHEVTKGQLEQLACACRCVRETIIQVNNGDSENPQFSVDENVAKQHLPLIETPGLFFGTNQYGAVYAADVIRTLQAVKRILHTTDFEKEVVYFNAIW